MTSASANDDQAVMRPTSIDESVDPAGQLLRGAPRQPFRILL